MRRVVFLLILSLAVLMIAPSALAVNGPKVTDRAMSATGFRVETQR